MTSKNTPRTPVITADVDAQGTLILTFSDGRELSMHPATLAPSIIEAATLHGLKQKLVDAAAIARNPDTGRSATIADKYDAVKEVFDRITQPNGTWNKIRGDGTGNTSGLLVRAIMQLKNLSREKVEAFLGTKSKEEKAELTKNPKIAAIIVTLRAVNPAIDTDAMLDDLEGL